MGDKKDGKVKVIDLEELTKFAAEDHRKIVTQATNDSDAGTGNEDDDDVGDEEEDDGEDEEVEEEE